MAESDLSWSQAWLQAEAEIGGVPRQPWVLRALRVVFLVSTGFVIWLALSFGTALISEFVVSIAWNLGLFLMVLVFPPLAIYATIRLARRFPSIPVPIMIALPALVIGLPFLWDALN